VRFDPEHVVPRARRSPDLFELEQVRVDEDPKLRAVAKGRNASSGTRGYADVALGFGHNALKVTVADMSSIWKHR
jgi:hypothetical protein